MIELLKVQKALKESESEAYGSIGTGIDYYTVTFTVKTIVGVRHFDVVLDRNNNVLNKPIYKHLEFDNVLNKWYSYYNSEK